MQHTQHIAMVRPAAFGYNEETAANNHFQTNTPQEESQLHSRALAQFDAMVSLLRDNGIDVLVFQDEPQPPRPDAIFPNNWFCCNNNMIQVFPMFAPSRRLEKNWDLLDAVRQQTGITVVKDWGSYEEKNMFLEGTGSMIIDHDHNIAYACLSARTDENLFQQFCKENNYLPIAFSAADEKGREIYHTNVMMAIGQNFAVVCLDAITDSIDRKKILHELQTTGHEIIDISFEQMNAFAGNMLELLNDQQETILVMSLTAFRSLSERQLQTIRKYARIVHPDVSAIESTAGGSVRCMMAELFY
ncbi:MAG: amidinotransferase [Sphingobacteriales bacterium]|nr:MAG: amidinotransferase [Sphingobacteriales bacterium]